MKTKLDSFVACARAFLRSERGNIAMMFGVALVPLMIGAGAGLDFARAMMVRQQMAEALDAAALAVGSTTGMDATKAQDLATKYFNANYTVDKSQYGTVTIDPPVFDAKGSITLTAQNSMPTVLMKLVGIVDLPLKTTSTVVWGQTKLWVSLVLDNSGSMCEPDPQPCLNDTNTASKIYQLKDATKTMLTGLQAVSTTPGDVQVAIVPFARAVDVGTGNVSASWLYWGFWEAQPANAALDNVTDNNGPGGSCPFSTGSKGYTCQTSATNGASTTSTIPSSGLICPSLDSGAINPDRHSHYYNGCYDSTPTQTLTTTTPVNTPTTLTQTCTQIGSGTITCNSGSNSTGSSTTGTVTTATTAGYTGDSTSSSTSSSTAAPSNGSKSCSTKKGVTTCTWTRTTVTTSTTTTIVKTGVGPWKHTWVLNSHSTWGGCVTDRFQNYDVSNTAPSSSDTTGFPADNPSNRVSSTDCMYANVTPLEHDWTDLAAKVDALQAKGSTNQGIGVAHGWQLLVPSGTYGSPGPLPANTTRYIILFSDGLNTQNRWWGDGSTEGTTQDGYIDARMNLACSAAKTDGVVIFTMYVHVGGGGNSAPLQNCASDSTKYYDLTSSSQIAAAFADITKKITNVRVSM
jgi:Flp pilus assembly protein TadG